MILAGGLGSRLRSVVSDVPKPMAPVLGRPFLEHQMDHWIGQGVSRFVLSVGYKADVVRGHFGARYKGAEVDYAVEQIVQAVTRLREMSPLWEMAQEGIDIKSIEWSEH